MILIDNSFNCAEIYNNVNLYETESAWSVSKLGNGNFSFGVIYRPPNSAEEYTNKLINQINYGCERYTKSNIILYGDFNLPNIDWEIPYPIINDKATNSFFKCIMNRGLIQIVDFKTRKENTLDLILCNTINSLPYVQVVPPPVPSDHEYIEFLVEVNRDIKHYLTRSMYKYNFKKANCMEFLQYL